MRKSLLVSAAVSCVLLGGAASAADLPVKAPTYQAAAASSWSGFYLGGGLGFRSSQTSETFTSESVGGGPFLPPPATAATREPLNGIAFRGNVFAGYNFQVARRWVLGLEGDVGFADQTTNFAGLAFPDQNFTAISAADGLATRTKWDASARARLGFLVTPATLVYATGGAAWQHYDITTTCIAACAALAQDFALFPALLSGPSAVTPAHTNNSATKLGWTVGGGVETSLGGHWFARADYRFADFGTTTFALTRNTTFVPFNPIVDTFDVPLRTHTVSFGLAYKFGDEVGASAPATWLDGVLPTKAPAMKAPTVASWSGLYAGAGLGVRVNDSQATTVAVTDALVLGFSSITANSEPIDGTAFRSAPYIGWNWQIAPRWVAGIEGDVGFADHTTSIQGFGSSPGIPSFDFLNKIDSFALRTTWDASARARVGYLVTPATLLYATAGAAWQHFDVKSACVSVVCTGVTPAIVTDSVTKTGWTAGLGAETMLSGNWFARAEYRYADFRPSSLTISRQFGGTPLSTNFDVAMRTHMATFGVSYKFGGVSLAPN